MSAWIVTAILLLEGGANVPRHERMSESWIEISGRQVSWRLQVSIQALEKVMELPADPIELSEAQVQSVKDEIVRNLRPGVGLDINGTGHVPKIGELVPVYGQLQFSGEPYIEHVQLVFRYECREEIEDLLLAVNLFAAVTDQHQATLEVRWDGKSRSFMRTGASTVALEYELFHPTVLGAAERFGLRGLQAMVLQAGTVAFLVGALLGTGHRREAILSMAAFAGASVLAVMLTGLKVVSIKEGIAAALVAASVVYVGVENLLSGDGKWRWVVTLVFGLAHGLVAGEGVREAVALSERAGLSMFMFVAGTVAGQGAILLVAGPACAVARGGDDVGGRRRKAIVAGSVPLIVLGVGWLAERLFSSEFMPI